MVAIQTLLASFLLYSIPTCLALSPISTTGAKFYDESGNQFFIKGAPIWQLLLAVADEYHRGYLFIAFK